MGEKTSDPQLFVGCPQWSLPGWSSNYFPQHPKDTHDLRHYSQWVNAVEGNTTFYAIPTPQKTSLWLEQLETNFRFCFKLHRSITHERKLRNASEELHAFLSAVEPLGHTLGPLWIQLPASFSPADLTVLEKFLQLLPADYSWAVEVRHRLFEAEALHERQLNDLLYRYKVDRIIFDSRALFAGPCITPQEREAWERKPRLKVRPVALSQNPTVRFIGQTAPEENSLFWDPWLPKIVQWIQEGRTPYIFIHTPDNVHGLTLCRLLYEQIRNRMPQLSSLPEPPNSKPATLF